MWKMFEIFHIDDRKEGVFMTRKKDPEHYERLDILCLSVSGRSAGLSAFMALSTVCGSSLCKDAKEEAECRKDRPLC